MSLLCWFSTLSLFTVLAADGSALPGSAHPDDRPSAGLRPRKSHPVTFRRTKVGQAGHHQQQLPVAPQFDQGHSRSPAYLGPGRKRGKGPKKKAVVPPDLWAIAAPCLSCLLLNGPILRLIKLSGRLRREKHPRRPRLTTHQPLGSTHATTLDFAHTTRSEMKTSSWLALGLLALLSVSALAQDLTDSTQQEEVRATHNSLRAGRSLNVVCGTRWVDCTEEESVVQPKR
jgi:hypothetical protein